MKVIQRNENIIDSHHFNQFDNLSALSWKKALPALEALRDEILVQRKSGVLSPEDAYMRLNAAQVAFGNNEVFSQAIQNF
jgi:hypothetical protein